MDYLKAAIMGAVQGLTEFLPVSSSGHLALLAKLGMVEDDFALFFTVMLHVGTLLAVLIVYRKKLWGYIKRPLQPEVGFLLIATAITVGLVVISELTFADAAEELFSNYYVIGTSFIVTSVLLFVAEIFGTRKKGVGPVSSTLTGIVQSVAALFPGISRSGSTIAVQTLLGVDREKAADFSFLLSIPVILGAAVWEGKDVVTSGLGDLAVGPLLLGVAVSFVTGILAIKLFLTIVKKLNFYPFSAYTFILGLLCFIFG